jgi:DDB1- and CUL4-associated factor 11
LTQGKDQCIKLWDLRMMKGSDYSVPPRRSFMDYRYPAMQFQQNPRARLRNHPDDCSIGTIRGHQVYETLIRAYFSPEATTGQRYIYTGSSDGFIYIYDTLTGDIVERLGGHHATVRDVSWHPHKCQIVSSSWDGTIRSFEMKRQ